MTHEALWYAMPTLIGPGIRLEPLTFEHAAGYLAAAGTPAEAEEIFRWQSPAGGALSHPVTHSDAQAHVASALAARARGARLPYAVIDTTVEGHRPDGQADHGPRASTAVGVRRDDGELGARAVASAGTGVGVVAGAGASVGGCVAGADALAGVYDAGPDTGAGVVAGTGAPTGVSNDGADAFVGFSGAGADALAGTYDAAADTGAGVVAEVSALAGVSGTGTMAARPGTSAFAGTTSFADPDPRLRSITIGYTWLGKRWWRTGLNAQAKSLMLTYAFETLGAVRVVLVTDIRNTRAQAAIERLGAHKEGVLRKHRRRADGSWRDTVTYALIDDDWPAAKRRLAERIDRLAQPPVSPPAEA